MKKLTLWFVLTTMFLSTAGFTIIIPVLPFLVDKYVSVNNTAIWLGIVLSVYSACQFLSAAPLGTLSDRIGRRPVLLISLFGSFVGYLITGFSGALWVLLLGRVVDGLTGGNISTIYAYIADSVQGQDRGRYYGYLGAAGGLGFMIGPAIGGFAGSFSLTLPLFIAAGVAVLTALFGIFVLPESLTKEKRSRNFEWTHLNPFFQFKELFKMKDVRWLLLIGFLFFFPLTGYQGNISVFVKDIFQFGPAGIGAVLFTVGVFDIFSQGFLTHKLLPVFGEKKLTEIGAGITAVGFAMIASLVLFHPSIYATIYLFAAVIVTIIGDGLFEPAFSGLLSNTVDNRRQGQIQGANQSMQSFARIWGPLAAAGLYTVSQPFPYIGGALLFIVTAIFIFGARIKDASKPSAA
jgi:DHA1 family tetracycline resistance protein-like MFS transporter